MQPDLLEELFFSGLIGSVQIDSVIPYILNMQVGHFSWIVIHIFLFLNCDPYFSWIVIHIFLLQLAEYGGMEEQEEPIETEFEAVKEEIQ